MALPTVPQALASPPALPALPAALPAPVPLAALPALPTALAALGVVFGDIGTSPMYALRECFHGAHGTELSPANILGVLSLIVWALIVVISVEYLLVILRADYEGEGGILALVALAAKGRAEGRSRTLAAIWILGIFGAALLYGDGIITQ